MYSRHAAREILIPLPAHDEPSIDNHVPKLLLAGEPLDALDEVLVAVPIARDQLPNQRDRAKAPPLVHGVEQGVLVDLAELEDRQHTARFQHAVRLAQGSGDVAEVADAERHCVQVDRGVGDAGGAQVLGVGLEEGERGLLAGGEEGGGALLADGEHGWVDVGDGDADIGVGVEDVGGVEVPEGDVPRAACDIEDVLWGRGGICAGWGVEAWVEGGDVVISVFGGEKAPLALGFK